MTHKNLFIVFEGMDGAGTTTQTNLLHEYLSSKTENSILSSHKTAEPTTRFFGRALRSILAGYASYDSDTLALLFAADRTDHCNAEIIPHLAERHVVCDRYYYSSMAYQGDTPEQMAWVYDINRQAIRPDIVFYIKVETQVAWERLQQRKQHDIYEKESFLHALNKRYDDVFEFVEKQHQSNPTSKKEKIVTLDGNQTIAALHQQIINHINTLHEITPR